MECIGFHNSYSYHVRKSSLCLGLMMVRCSVFFSYFYVACLSCLLTNKDDEIRLSTRLDFMSDFIYLSFYFGFIFDTFITFYFDVYSLAH